MLGAPFQIVLVLVLATVGVISVRQDHGTAAGMAFAVAGVALVSLIRYGGVMAAGRQYRAGRGASAWRELGRVPLDGRLLARQHRTYYGLLRTACRMDREEWEPAIGDARQVLAIERVPLANHATAHAAIAKCSLMLGDRAAARDHVDRAKALPRKPRLERLIAEIERGLADETDGHDEGAPQPIA